MSTLPATRQPWRFFDVEVAAAVRRSPGYVRLTFAGHDLDEVADNGFDQRIKLVLPDARGRLDALPTGPEWYAEWRRLPAERQNPIRTYTVRAVRPEAREVDVDVVLHGDTGPASRFAAHARPGDRRVLLAPDRGFAGHHGGLEFRPPVGHRGPTLLVGDATAVPAVLAVLERLPHDAHGEAVLEVPDALDIADVARPIGVRVTWLVGAAGVPAAVDAALGRLGVRASGAPEDSASEPADVEDLLWDVPESAAPTGLYAWIAGEAGLVTGLRRHLVRDLGVDRGAVAFMGYWREGRAGA